MSNMGLDIAMRKAGGKVIKTDVGDRYVVEEMRRGGYNLGGEQSGHMIFLDHNTTGDGLLSALQVLSIIRRTGRSLSDLADVMIPLPQVLVNVRVRERKDIMSFPDIASLVKRLEERVGENGRLLLRYSGTEPLLRIMLEGQDKYEITAWAKELAEAVEKKLGGK
jgi:phosphoglucosamine mutase